MATSADITMVRIRAYLNLPLMERCRELALLIDESSTTELQHVFPILIDSIFGITDKIGWELHNINLKKCPYEYETLCHFLGPQGPIFSLCYKLLPDSYLKYDFPVSCLPTKIKCMLQEGIIPPFYADKLKDDQNTRQPSALSMNPFEYYIFHFAYHLTNPWLQLQQTDNVWMNWETVYVQLAHSYLYHFLPRDNSPVLPVIGPYYMKQINPRKLMQSPESKRLQQAPRLLRTSILSPGPQISPVIPQQQCLSQVWRSETVVQVFLDFWLEYTEEDKLFTQINPAMSSQLPRRHSIHTGEHIRLVRAFIKTLHEFANSARGDKSAMDELKRVIVPSVQGKIYTFLRKAIHHWPLDSSFRLILEAWLSFIQPWRYIPENNYRQVKNDEDERGKIQDPSCWMCFVSTNLLAYTTIFEQLLPRFMRTDLVTPKNALMLFRVTKVFSQPYLASMIAEAESCMDEANVSRGKMPSNQWSQVVRQQIIEREGPTYQYIPIFSEATQDQVSRLLSIIRQAYLTSVSIVGALEKRQCDRRFPNLLWQFFNLEETIEDDISLAERKRVPGLLASAQQQLVDIFALSDVSPVTVAADQEYHDSILSTSANNRSNLDSSSDSSRPGVFMPVQKERQNCRYIEYLGDPDLQPVRSNEYAFLVRQLYKLCCLINEKYENELTRVYNRTDFIGRIAKKVLLAPTTVSNLPKRTAAGFTERESRDLPPRLSLRFAASYNFVRFIIAGALLSRIMGYSTSMYIFLAFFLWALFIVLGAGLEPWIPLNSNPFRGAVFSSSN